MTTARWITILVWALWLASCASRHQQTTTPTASPRNSTSALVQTTVGPVNTNLVVYVEREVKAPGPIVWTPDLTLTKAIALAKGFTDFANRRRIEIRRTNGSVEEYNYLRLRNGSSKDPALKPNDQIYVRGSLD